MASTRKICLLTIVVLFAVIQTATSSLKCLTCKNAPTCDTTESLPCENGNDQCLKIVNGKGDKLRDKKCGTLYECQTYKNCYACDNEDNCNSSSSIMPCFLLMGIASVIVCKWYM